jgi:capsid protein
VSAEQRRRRQWLGDHAETFAYRDQLLDAVAERGHELGFRAAITQPAHVVDIIGAVPTDSPEATRRWINSAARIEAYREEWAVAPERLRERPWDACQQRAWDEAVRTTELLARPVPARTVERCLDHGMELGM